MDSQKILLKNGLETVFIDAPLSPTACVQIWFRSGSTLETKENSGIAHFLEHMFFKGTHKRPDGAISYDVESFGGEINAFTSFDYTCYYINTPGLHLIETIDILMDMVSNPLFLKKEIIPERQVVFEEYRRSYDSPSQYAFLKIQRSSFPVAYARPILGSEENIKNFSKSDLIAFRKKFYNLGTAFLVVAGDLQEKNKIIRKIESFQLLKGSYRPPPVFHLKDRPTIDVHQKDVEMSQLTLIFESPSLKDDTAAIGDLAFNILGSGSSSLLSRELVYREGLANTSSAFTMFFNTGGIHLLKINFPPENLKKILKELKRVLLYSLKHGFDQQEIEKVKNQYIATKIYDRESLESFAFTMGQSLANTQDLFFEDKFIDKVKRVSREDIHRYFMHIFAQHAHLSLQIPQKNHEVLSSKKILKEFLVSFQKLKPLVRKGGVLNALKYSKYDEQLEMITLKRGVRLLYRKNSLTPTFVLHAYVHGGLTWETVENHGTSSLLSCLLTQGYSGISFDELNRSIESMSASLQGFSGKDSYGLQMHGLTENSEILLKHFFGSLLEPSIDKKRFDQEREMTERQLKIQKEEPVKECFRIISEVMFEGQPYSLNPLGSFESLQKLKSQDLDGFHKDHFNNNEILFTYCGDQELQEIVRSISRYLKDVTPGKRFKLKKRKYTTFPAMEDQYLFFDRQQTQIFLGFQTRGISHHHHIYLKIISSYFAGQSSELFVDVRDRKGLCYATAPIHMDAVYGGYWGIYMASGHDKVHLAVRAIKELMDNVRVNGLKYKDFKRIKKMIRGHNIVNIQTNEDYANLYSIPMFQGLGVDFFHINNRKIMDLSYEIFQKNIKMLFSKKRALVIVGRKNYQGDD